MSDKHISAFADLGTDRSPTGGSGPERALPLMDLSFRDMISRTRMAVCVSDPRLPDAPIVFANDSFLELTGYDREEVEGRNCRFLQGDDTDPAEVARLRQAIDAEHACVVELLNYRKDGSAFWNALHIGPVYDCDGKLAYFYGSQWDVSHLIAHRSHAQQTRALVREMHHRVQNQWAVAASLVRLSARGETDVDAVVKKASSRILALGQAHAATLAPKGADNEMADFHSLVESMMRPHRHGQQGRVVIDGPAINLPADAVTPMGLTLYELGTNAAQHGSLCNPEGVVHVSWSVDDSLLQFIWRETRGDAPKRPEPRAEGFGMRAVSTVLASIDARIDRDWSEEGLEVRITMALGDKS
ncbi:PAS domain-containing protein [Rhizobiaceae bacterium]|nr:PAS domain-containing protein [Rhizobiaceae bacterium]